MTGGTLSFQLMACVLVCPKVGMVSYYQNVLCKKQQNEGGVLPVSIKHPIFWFLKVGGEQAVLCGTGDLEPGPLVLLLVAHIY